MKTLFLAWQDPQSRTWYPIGKLTHHQGLYHFTYLHGALIAQREAGLTPIVSFPHFEHHYTSSTLFPLFANRLLQKSRPDYADFLQWLNLSPQHHDPISILARSGGQRKTDHFEVFPQPEKDQNGNYQTYFFARGLRYFPTDTQTALQTLKPRDPLQILHDLQNPVDSRALLLKTANGHLAGYCPRYLTQDFFELVCRAPHSIKVTVEQVNPPPTPAQFQLLCQLTATWPDDFQPFSGPIYEEIADPISV